VFEKLMEPVMAEFKATGEKTFEVSARKRK
jgi:hypothetical protein